MWSCWLHQTLTSNSRWTSSQPSVKRPGWESAPPNPSPWSSTGKGWSALSGSGMRSCPKWRSSSTSGSLFTSEGRMEREIDRRIGAASAVMRTLHGSVVVKRELSRKAKLSIYQSIYVPALSYGHELWVVTERTRSRVQAAEMSFLRRVAGLSLRDRVRSSVIREELGVDPLLLRVEKSQMRWLGHLVRMPPGRLPGEVFRARPTGRRPRGRPRTRWRDYVSRLAWERLGIPQEELDEVAGEREIWASLLRLLPPRPDPDKRKKMDGWMDGCTVTFASQSLQSLLMCYCLIAPWVRE